MFTVGPNEILMIIVIIALLFGASKIPELARALGRARGEFEKEKRKAELEAEELERELRKVKEEERKEKREVLA